MASESVEGLQDNLRIALNEFEAEEPDPESREPEAEQGSDAGEPVHAVGVVQQSEPFGSLSGVGLDDFDGVPISGCSALGSGSLA